MEAWVRFADGRDPDLLGLVCLVDAFPPVVGEVGITGWVPTLELTCHLRARPRSSWLAARVRTQVVQGGLAEEDCALWDTGGRLVAQSRQLARPLLMA